MQCTYTPSKDKKKTKLPKLLKAVDGHRRELCQSAVGRVFTFNSLPMTDEWIKIEVTDGKKQTNIIEVFDALSTKKTCTCNQYFNSEASYCVHLAAFEGIDKLGWSSEPEVKKWLMDFSKNRIKIPLHSRMFKGGAIYYDSYQGGQVVVGKVPNFSENWMAYGKWKQSQPKKLAPATKNSYSSAGLLRSNLKLYDYQEDIFQKMLNARRAICSMTMGSGKTLTTIACYAEILKANPQAKMLVVAPKSLCLQWGAEFTRALGISSVLIKTTADIARAKTERGPFITTYQFLTRHIDLFKVHKYDVAIVDEIQFVKNGDTKTWKAVNKVKSDYFFGLSGTVIENRLDDFYAIMQIINPGLVGPKWKFDHTYQEVLVQTSSKIIYKGTRNLDQLKALLKDYVFFYDKLNLPPISHLYIPTTCTQQQQATHDEYREKAKLLISKSMNTPLTAVEKILVQAFLLKARQSACATELITKTPDVIQPNKMVEFETILKDVCLNKGEKLVVFSQWTEHLEIASRSCKALGLGTTRFTGQETAKKRSAAVVDFQNDPTCMVFLASDAGGVGLDGLQLVACHLVHLELPWNPAVLDQRSGRVYRNLQTKPVTIYHLIAQGTIEESIEALLKSKREIRIQTLSNFL